MNSIQTRLAAAAAVALFGIGLASNAGARSTVAWAGAPNPLTAGSCFSESYGRVTNTGCAAQEIWEVALPVDAAGAWIVTPNVTPTSNPSTVRCMAYAVDQNVDVFWTSANAYATAASVPQNLTLGVDVPSGGALYLGCFLQQGAAVNTINWNQ